MDKLNDKTWLEDQVKTKPLRYIAKELNLPYSRIQNTIKKLGVIVPKRTKYVYTEESRRYKSELIKFRLQQKYPNGRYGDLASNWRGGFSLCINCSEVTSRKDAIRCLKCERTNNRIGEKNVNWRGGISPENMRIRSSKEYKAWRKSVLERDDYTCQICSRSRDEEPDLVLHADHIKAFSEDSEYRLDINNGRTLCIECHKKTDNFAGKLNKNKEYKKHIVKKLM